MPNWYVKAALQGTMSLLPDPQKYNRVFQRFVTGTDDLSVDFFRKKVAAVDRHLDVWSSLATEPLPKHIVELGSGWHPIVPVALLLRGAERVTSLDVQHLTQTKQVRNVLACFEREVSENPGRWRSDASEIVARGLASSGEPAELLGAMGIELLVADARHTSLAPGTVDFIISNNTFEHIPAPTLSEILHEFRRVLSDDGVMSHMIDLQDHYAGFDSSITVYNFLAFSERRWKLFNNGLQYQNRLRYSEYVAMAAAAGWTVAAEDLTSDLSSLASVDVHKSFDRFSQDDLAVHTAWMGFMPQTRVQPISRPESQVFVP